MIPLHSLRWAMLVAAAWLVAPTELSAQVDPLLGDGYTRLVIRGATVRAGQGRGDRVIEAEGKWVMPGIIGTEDGDAAVSLSGAQRAGNAPFDAPHLVVYPFWRGSDPRLWDPTAAAASSARDESGVVQPTRKPENTANRAVTFVLT